MRQKTGMIYALVWLATTIIQNQMGGLAGNLEKLNGIYGNMLSAMRS